VPFNVDQDPYIALRNIVAEQTRPILAWVGSGASASAGLPTWPPLRRLLIDALNNKADTLAAGDRKKLYASANRAEQEENPWVAFEILQKSLGATSFRDLIRAPFSEVHRIPTPAIYADLWKLRIKGMLTLNLDRLAARSMGEAHPGQTLVELSGTPVERLRGNLSGPRPIVANLHGIFEDTATWVFTQRQLSQLLRRQGYVSFIETCLSMFTIIFVGITVDDIAVGSHLARLSDKDIETPTHYWITDHQEFYTDKWAEGVGIRVIRYASPGTDHTELAELFRDLTSYVSIDKDELPPVNTVSAPATETSLPSESEVVAWPANEIRLALNAHAIKILTPRDSRAYRKYAEFSREYDQAIYRAWYVSAEPGKNKLLGYAIEEHVARGAFGNVYRARSDDGQEVAIKVLLDEVRQDQQGLQSFRRGVQSMRILEERGVPGMAAYLEASEIPACVVMEWVDGPNLDEAKKSQQITDWHTVLVIAEKLTSTIRTAHMLPERVLHRDIRPANVMLRDHWTDQDKLDVVVLDFDLSWHRGALEQSVLHTTSAGYLAPEQLRPRGGASTRSAFVDAFGIGMTLLYLCGGQEPIADQHRHTSWEMDVAHACSQLSRPKWVSLPRRFARLILACTQDVQSDRWDLAEIARELRLLGAASSGNGELNTELVVEELAARSTTFADYTWDADMAQAMRDVGTGLGLSLTANLTDDTVEATVSYASGAEADRGKIRRHIAQTSRILREQFVAAGWKVTRCDAGAGDMHVRASVASGVLAADLDGTAAFVDRVLGNLNMDRH
jgi:serine/threonine protein kinase